jgi:hypothetical protein
VAAEHVNVMVIHLDAKKARRSHRRTETSQGSSTIDAIHKEIKAKAKPLEMQAKPFLPLSLKLEFAVLVAQYDYLSSNI